MKVRLMFTKTGLIRYVGHLDFMRYMQKAITRSGLPGVYTMGFSPHLIMSFADPLGVGMESLGDYLEVEFAWHDPYAKGNEIYRIENIGLDNDALPEAPCEQEILLKMNQAQADGVEFLSARRIGETKEDKSMAIVRWASYMLAMRDEFHPEISARELSDACLAFMEQEQIFVTRKSKKTEKRIDIKPWIPQLSAGYSSVFPFCERAGYARGRVISITCAAGSTQNLKPEAFLEAFCGFMGIDYDRYGFSFMRCDLMDGIFTSLKDLGQPLGEGSFHE